MKEKNKTVFVTGVTGLLGNNLVRQLIAKKCHVKALVRSPEKAARQFTQDNNLEIITGDITNIGSFETALNGCDTIYHTAAII